MNEDERIEKIKQRLSGNEYFIHPLSDASTKEDIEYLLNMVKKKDDRIAFLDKKSEVLTQQIQELTTEIENVRSDFGNQR